MPRILNLTAFFLAAVATSSTLALYVDDSSLNEIPDEGVMFRKRNQGFPEDEDMFGHHLSPQDFSIGRGVADQDPIEVEGEDPITTGSYFEGDIVVDPEDIVALNGSNSMNRNAVRNPYLLWPNGEVPYVISSSYNSRERGIIASAMEEYHEKTCIRFVPRTNQKDYIHISKNQGCSSNVGRFGGSQTVSLGNGCVYKGIVEHELMHALGFWHEQSRADRDDYVIIYWNNIQSSMQYNFQKYSLSQIDHLGAPYDTCSVMHYNAYAFSSNGQKTIGRTSKDGGKCELGQRQGFSEVDLKKINTLYKCSGFPSVSGGEVSGTEKPEVVATIKPDLSCKDTNVYCATWAQSGECQINPSWMLKNCPVSCDECKNKCADHEVHCNEWKAAGECKKNAAYMNIYCAKSCGKCKSDENCKDENDYCQSWADKDYCNSGNYVSYMTLRCKKSCNLC